MSRTARRLRRGAGRILAPGSTSAGRTPPSRTAANRVRLRRTSSNSSLVEAGTSRCSKRNSHSRSAFSPVVRAVSNVALAFLNSRRVSRFTVMARSFRNGTVACASRLDARLATRRRPGRRHADTVHCLSLGASASRTQMYPAQVSSVTFLFAGTPRSQDEEPTPPRIPSRRGCDRLTFMHAYKVRLRGAMASTALASVGHHKRLAPRGPARLLRHSSAPSSWTPEYPHSRPESQNVTRCHTD